MSVAATIHCSMKGLPSRILLPVTADAHFPQAAGMALQLAEDFGAEITVLTIDDDSDAYETVSLPFHERSFVANIQPAGDLSAGEIGDRASKFLLDAVDRKVKAEEMRVRGHTATQVLLVSLYHDFIVTSAEPLFAWRDLNAPRRVNPVMEILDQTVVPLLMAGTGGSTALRSAAVLFDGGPCATQALHGLAAMLSDRPQIPVHVRVSRIDENVAQRLAGDCEKFLRSKGFENVIKEYSAQAPMEAVTGGDFSPVDVTAMGIRSRNTFHDLHVGMLAKHLIENPPSGHTLFC